MQGGTAINQNAQYAPSESDNAVVPIGHVSEPGPLQLRQWLMLLANMLPGCRTAHLNVLNYGAPAQDVRYESEAAAEQDPEQTPHNLISLFQNEQGKFELHLSFTGLDPEQVDTAQTLIDWNLHVFALLYPGDAPMPEPAPAATTQQLKATELAPLPAERALVLAPQPTRAPVATRLFAMCIGIVGTVFGGWLAQPSDFHLIAAAVVGPASQDRISAVPSPSPLRNSGTSLQNAAAAGSLALALDTSLTRPSTTRASMPATPPGAQHRIFIELPAQDAEFVRAGQQGVFTLISDPDNPLPFTLGEVQASTREVNGKPHQRIAAVVDDPKAQLLSKGGLSGHAHIEVSRQANAWVMWRNLQNRFR